MKNLILCPNVQRDTDFAVTNRVERIARAMGINVSVYPMFDEDTSEERAKKAERFRDSLTSAELVVALGGDGTMLRAARLTLNTGVPILGINMGGKGFLAEVEPSQLDLFEDIFREKFSVEDRMTLNVELIREGKTAVSDIAINDVVISGAGKVIDIAVFGDGHRISRFEGDGMIIATPTGSTAYSMAAGGPIVEPGARNILVTPICAHVLVAKPYVLVSDRQVTVEIGFGKRNEAYMTVDGNEKTWIMHGDSLRVYKSDKTVCFAHIPDMNFYRRVSEKLGDSM